MDKQKINFSFSRAARQYDHYAWLPQDLAARLLRLVSSGRQKPKNILDIGCGTGTLAISLSKRFKPAKVIGFDLASGMVQVAKGRKDKPEAVFLQADLEKIPFRAGTFDMVVSNSVYQRSRNLQIDFRKVNRILIAGGKFYLSIITRGTLSELQSSFMRACKKRMKSYPVGVYRHPQICEVIKALKDSGFIVMQTATYKKMKYYSSAAEIIRWLKSIGANYYYRMWMKGLNCRPVLQDLENYYKSRYGKNGRIPATFCGLIIEAKKQ